MIEEIDGAAYNKHYLEKVGTTLLAPPTACMPRSEGHRFKCPLPPPYPASRTTAALAPPPRSLRFQVYNEVGADAQTFLAAALDFLKQETGFFAQPGAADVVARLVQARLPVGGAAPSSAPAAGATPAVAAAAAARPAAAGAAPAAAPDAQQGAAGTAAAPEAAPAEQSAAPGPAEAAEAAEPSTLSERPALLLFPASRI